MADPVGASDLKQKIEALLFAAGEPLSVDTMLSALGSSGAIGRADVEDVLASLGGEYPAGGTRGFELVPLAGGWAFRTNPCCREVVAALFELPEDTSRLSAAAMECLSIVAYLQPVTRPQIAEVRGVNSDSPVRTLVERELITEVGRAQSAGGALLYGTTPRFEAVFGLAGLDELPPLEGFALGEEQKDDLRRRLGLATLSE